MTNLIEQKTTIADPVSLILNPTSMSSVFEFAKLMSSGISTMPKHLQGNVSDCVAICMQAMRWGMDPFVVGQKTYLVNGALGYEAQLVNAVLQTTGAIVGRFHYEYQGEGQAVSCRVGAIPAGESEIVWGEWLKASDVTVKNSPLWKSNPKQQLGYLQVKYWARLYKPAAIMGVYTVDELQEVPQEKELNQAPSKAAPALSSSLKARQAAPAVTEDLPDFIHQLQPGSQKIADRLLDCLTIEDLNSWGAEASEKVPAGHVDCEEMSRLYNERLSQITEK
jgi:hypothetical protein